MPYYNVTTNSLYQFCLGAGSASTEAAARAWVEAENTEVVFAVLQRWFEFMENGVDDMIAPSADFAESQVRVDALVEAIDTDFLLEKTRFRDRGAPDFSRLGLIARRAFAEEVWAVLKDDDALTSEATRRLAEGEVFPHMAGQS